jgi:hypothetical protein
MQSEAHPAKARVCLKNKLKAQKPEDVVQVVEQLLNE